MSKAKKCASRGCRHLVFKSGKSPYCSRCRSRRWKARNPAKYAFHHLRNRAGERGHSFTLSFEKFTELWNSGLAQNHGRGIGFLSIDRIKNDLGYSDDNVRLLLYEVNSRRQFVGFFARQVENVNFKPNEHDIKEAEAAMAEAENQPEL